jgi:hypothetical protein
MAFVDNIVAFYDFNDLADSTVNRFDLIDNSLGGNSMFSSGAVTLSGGSYLTAVISQFDSASASASFWVNPASIQDSGQRIGILGLNLAETGILFRYGSSTDGNPDQLYIFGEYLQWNTVPDLPINSWTHVVITVGNGECKAYVNSVLAKTKIYNPLDEDNNLKTFGSTVNLTLGTNPHALNSGVFNGQLDALGIWNRTLTQEEITEIFNNGRTYELNSPTPSVTPTETPAPTPSVTPNLNLINQFTVFDKFAYNQENGYKRFLRLRHLGYL